jgi:mannopine transport system substrate-binding protein
VIAGGTGAYLDLVKQHFYDPFTAATGIKVTNAGGSYGEKLAKLKAMNAVGRVEWDAITLSVDALTPETNAMLRDLQSCGEIPAVCGHGICGSCLGHGVMFDIGGGLLAFNRETFPGAKPASWSDFWDVAKFPGPRALPNIGTPWWPLMAALQADGVAPDKLFPLDLDRGFRKLDQIKSHITVWWRSGDQSQQIFRTKEVVMAMMFAGRAQRLQAEGLPIDVVWKGAPLDASVWSVTKGAARPNAAMALLEFVYSRPEAHAAFAQASFGSTAHKDALGLIPAAARSSQAVSPANWSGIVRVDPAWVAANQDNVTKRFTDWLAR